MNIDIDLNNKILIIPNNIKRKVEVKERPIINSKKGVAVLNYHFFFGEGENCNQGICLSTVKF